MWTANELQDDSDFIDSMQLVGANILGLSDEDNELIDVTVSASSRRLAALRKLQNTVDVTYTANLPRSTANALPTAKTAAEIQQIYTTQLEELQTATALDYGTVDSASLETLASTLQTTIDEAIASSTHAPTPAPGTPPTTPAPPTSPTDAAAASGAFSETISCLIVVVCLASFNV